MKTTVSLLLALLMVGCTTPPSEDTYSPIRTASLAEQPPGESTSGSTTTAAVDSLFGSHWYQGEAEVTSYTLEQARYGEMREGKAVLVYVTEDFSKKKQVKLDDPYSAGEDRVNVLKLNMTKNFTTGIYPYSMMMSVFTPIYGNEHTLKVTTSSQEWCGHTFTQLNLRDEAYRIQLRSYFESEGDQTVDLDRVLLEDEIWTKIRLTPDALPTGSLQIIAGTFYQRLGHTALQVEQAEARLETAQNGEKAYTLTYPERTLTIRFKAAFPHEIMGWEETYTDGFGPNAQRLTTRAVRDESMMVDYWTRNSNADIELRNALNLDS